MCKRNDLNSCRSGRHRRAVG